MVRCGVDGDHFLPLLLGLLVLLVARGVLTAPVGIRRGGAGGGVRWWLCWGWSYVLVVLGECYVMVVLGGVSGGGCGAGSSVRLWWWYGECHVVVVLGGV